MSVCTVCMQVRHILLPIYIFLYIKTLYSLLFQSIVHILYLYTIILNIMKRLNISCFSLSRIIYFITEYRFLQSWNLTLTFDSFAHFSVCLWRKIKINDYRISFLKNNSLLLFFIEMTLKKFTFSFFYLNPIPRNPHSQLILHRGGGFIK